MHDRLKHFLILFGVYAICETLIEKTYVDGNWTAVISTAALVAVCAIVGEIVIGKVIEACGRRSAEMPGCRGLGMGLGFVIGKRLYKKLYGKKD